MPEAKHMTSPTPYASAGNAELGLAQWNELVGPVPVYRDLGGG
jgi:hypothetical protein